MAILPVSPILFYETHRSMFTGNTLSYPPKEKQTIGKYELTQLTLKHTSRVLRRSSWTDFYKKTGTCIMLSENQQS